LATSMRPASRREWSLLLPQRPRCARFCRRTDGRVHAENHLRATALRTTIGCGLRLDQKKLGRFLTLCDWLRPVSTLSKKRSLSLESRDLEISPVRRKLMSKASARTRCAGGVRSANGSGIFRRLLSTGRKAVIQISNGNSSSENIG